MPTKSASSADRNVAAEKTAPAQLEDRPFRFGQSHESITGVTNGIGRRGAELSQSIGQALVLLDQDIVARKWLAPHAIEHTLQLGAVSSMRVRTEFLRQMRNILTEFVHEPPLDWLSALDNERRQLICAMEPSQLGDSYLQGTGSGCADHKFNKVSRSICRNAFNVWLYE